MKRCTHGTGRPLGLEEMAGGGGLPLDPEVPEAGLLPGAPRPTPTLCDPPLPSLTLAVAWRNTSHSSRYWARRHLPHRPLPLPRP